MNQLPPGVEPHGLPEPEVIGNDFPFVGWSATQVRAIEAKAAQAGYLAGLKAAEKVCEQLHNDGSDDTEASPTNACAAAIRDLKGKQ